MPVKVDMSGLDRFKNNLKKLSGEHIIPLTELLPDNFMTQYTDFPTLQAMVDAAGVNDPEEIKAEAFSQFVADHTRFDNWTEMLTKGYAEYAKRTLES